MLLFAWLDRAPLANLATHPYSGMREAVAFVAAQPDSGAALRAGYGLGGDTARVYDPTLLHVESGEEIRALCARAQAEGRPLYVLLGYTGQNRKHRPDGLLLLDDPSLFEPLGRFEAVAPEFVYRVLRYRPAGRTARRAAARDGARGGRRRCGAGRAPATSVKPAPRIRSARPAPT